MVKIGMALCPLMIYAALYQSTKNLFNRWLIYMIGLTIQMGVLAITTVIAAKVTAIFLGTFTTFALASRATQGSYFISELQQSAIQAGFGMIITALLIWFPNNAGAFGGTKLYDKTTKSSLGTLNGLRSKYK
jgi:type IV secretion system protein VirB6